jgi:hypothetical protein
MHYSSQREAVKVELLTYLLSTLSGLRWVAPGLPPAVELITACGVQITHAVVCSIFAAQENRRALRWLCFGLVGGIFAVAVIVFLTRGRERSPLQPGQQPNPPHG